MIGKSMLLLSSSLLAGCVVTTRVVEHYDEECQIVTKHVGSTPKCPVTLAPVVVLRSALAIWWASA